jgi:two-component system cell cycle response regulator
MDKKLKSSLEKTIKNLKKENLLLEKRMKFLEKDLIHDNLTCLKTREFFEEELSMNLSAIFLKRRHKRDEDFGFTKLSILLMDADNFKNINDTYGHHAGDLVLKKVSKVLIKSIRKTDIAARFGGEEFVVLLPGVDESSAYNKAETIRKNIESTTFKNHPDLKITVSIGVTQAKDASALDLIKEADRAMYKAKHSGKNIVVKYSDISEPKDELQK